MGISPEEIDSNRHLLDSGLSSAEVLAYNAAVDQQIADALNNIAAEQAKQLQPEEPAPAPEIRNMDDVQRIIDQRLAEYGLQS